MATKPKVILLIETSHSYGRGLIRGIARYSRIHGPWNFYHLEPFYRRSASSTKKFLDGLKGCGATGIILREPDKNNFILELNLPTIVSPFTTLFIPGLPNIVAENSAIGRMGAEHLLDHGFKDFAYCGFSDYQWSCDRRKGFVQRIAQEGMETIIYKLPKLKSQRTWDKEQFILSDWLKSLPKPVGIMACTDDRSLNVCEACKIAGLHVPEQVAIVGVDNDRIICELSDPPLSSIVLNVEKTGYEAAALLDKLMAGQNSKEQTIPVEPLYVKNRQSTDILAVKDQDVAQALRFIRKHSKQPISVYDITNGINLSRRALEKRFRKAIGRTIHQEIIRVRTEQIIGMLTETNLTVSRIALSLGYTSTEHISRSFCQATGLSPLAYRKKHGIGNG